MTFEQYLQALSNEQRLNVLRYLKQFGEQGAVLGEIAAMQPILQSKTLDIRINHKYILWHVNEKKLAKSKTYLIKMENIQYCFYFDGDESGIGLVGFNGAHHSFYISPKLAIEIYNKLCSYRKGFENVKPYTSQDIIPEWVIASHHGIAATYVLKNNAIFYARKTLFRGTVEKVKVPDVSEIIWCSQFVDSDCEAGTSYIVQLYSLRDKGPCNLYFDSNYTASRFVFELKKRVPHLLYGCNEDYEEIYKRNPHELMAIAQSKMHG